MQCNTGLVADQRRCVTDCEYTAPAAAAATTTTKTPTTTKSPCVSSVAMYEVVFVVVAVPVRSVQLMSESLDGSRAVMYDMYDDLQPVVFTESAVRRVRCLVNGSYPAPAAAVYIGDDDVTDQFVAEVELVRDGVAPNIRELYYRLQLINFSFRIRHQTRPV